MAENASLSPPFCRLISGKKPDGTAGVFRAAISCAGVPRKAQILGFFCRPQKSPDASVKRPGFSPVILRSPHRTAPALCRDPAVLLYFSASPPLPTTGEGLFLPLTIKINETTTTAADTSIDTGTDVPGTSSWSVRSISMKNLPVPYPAV